MGAVSGSVPGRLVAVRRPQGPPPGQTHSHRCATPWTYTPRGPTPFSADTKAVLGPSQNQPVGCGRGARGCESRGWDDTPSQECPLVERDVCLREVGRWVLGASCPWAGPPSLAAGAVPGLCTSGSHCLQLQGGAQAAVRAGCPGFGDLPGPLRHPLRAGTEGQGEREEQNTGGGRRGPSLCSEEPFGFPHKSGEPAGKPLLLQARPCLDQADPRHTYGFVSKRTEGTLGLHRALKIHVETARVPPSALKVLFP